LHNRIKPKEGAGPVWQGWCLRYRFLLSLTNQVTFRLGDTVRPKTPGALLPRDPCQFQKTFQCFPERPLDFNLTAQAGHPEHRHYGDLGI
jgi:hypothetical protein